MEQQKLVREAQRAAENSYAPYSAFHVGAALLSEDGTIFRGANVENRSYGLSICAERSALVSAVSAGHTRFTAIAIFSPDSPYPISPCGACRQVLSEFLSPDTPLHFVSQSGDVSTHLMAEVFPFDALHELKDRQPRG